MVLTAGNKTAEGLRKFLHTAYTALKQGANDAQIIFRVTLCAAAVGVRESVFGGLALAAFSLSQAEHA